MSRIEEALDIVKRAKALGDYDVNVIGMAGEIIAEDRFGMSKTAVGSKTIDGYWRSQEEPRSVQVKGWSDARVRRYRGGTFFRIPVESGPDDLLVQKGDPPALPGRHSKFDSSGSPIVTPKCEPPSTTQGRNHETSEQFKSHPMGV